MKKFLKKKLFKSASSSAKQSISSLNSLGGEAFCGYHIDLSTVDSRFTKLHKASWVGECDKLKAALKKVDVNALDSENRTALHLATAGGHKEVVQLLLRSKAEVNLQDAEGKTPLIKAVECQHGDIARILLDQGADPNLVDHNGDTALHVALASGHPDPAASYLLHCNTDVSIQNKEGMFPLHLAILQKRPEVVELLLDKGADPNVQDEEKRTPLMVACRMGCASLASLLLNKGAIPTQTDLMGWTALDHATKAGHKECQEVLSVFTAGTAAPAEDMESWKSTESEASERPKKSLLPLAPQIMPNASPEIPNKGTPKSSTFNEHCKPSLLGFAKYGGIHSSEERLLMEEKPIAACQHAAALSPIGNVNEQLKNGEEDDDSVEAMLKKTSIDCNSSAAFVQKPDVPNESVATRHETVIQVPNTQSANQKKQLNDVDDVSKWFTEDTSFTESEMEEKASSLYVPSGPDRRPSVMDPDVHKSVEVLLPYDGQQLREEDEMKQANVLTENETKAEGKMMTTTVDNTTEGNVKRTHVTASASEWDSSEPEEDLPEEHNAKHPPDDGTLCRIDSLQGAEEIWEQNMVHKVSQEPAMGHTGNKAEEPASELVMDTSHTGIAVTDIGMSLKASNGTADDAPQRPPRTLTKNRLRSSWSSSTSSTSSRFHPVAQSNLRQQSLIVGSNGETNGAQRRHQSGTTAKPQLPKRPNLSSVGSSSSGSSRRAAAVPQERMTPSKQRACLDGRMSLTDKSLPAEGPVPCQGSNETPALCEPAAKAHTKGNGRLKETEQNRRTRRLSGKQSVERLLKEKDMLSKQLVEARECSAGLQAQIGELQEDLKHAREEIKKGTEECQQQVTITENLRTQLASKDEVSIREADVNETLDRQLAELDLELKGAKSLIKDLHHEIESLQRQMNSYKESADMYKEANEKQEGMFKSILAEKEAMWMDEKQKLLVEVQKRDAQIAEANSPSELAEIHEQLTSLHNILASLNAKASVEMERTCMPMAEDISALVKISNSTLSDLQNLNINVDQTSQLLQNISENLQNSSAQGKTIELSLDNLHQLIDDSSKHLVSTVTGLQTLASDSSSICETLERLEANQKFLADTLGELQALISKSCYSLTPDKAMPLSPQKTVARSSEECPVRDDPHDIKEGIARVLNKLDSFADEIKNASHSEAEDVARKIAESFEEYHTITKQDMLNLMNKISSDQEMIAKVSASLNERQKCQDAQLSAEFADLKLNQSRALEELQSLRDELIRMDASGMFEKIETIHADAAGKIFGTMEPVSTELKSLHATLDAHQTVLASKLDQGTTADRARRSQLQGIMERLDCVLDQTNSLKAKEELNQLKNVTVDIKGSFPDIDFPVLLNGLKIALSGLKEEIRRRHERDDQAGGHASSQVPTVPGCATPTHQIQVPLNSGIPPHQEKYRNRKALAKYKAELKAIKEKLKDIGQHQGRGNVHDNVQATLTAAELQRKVDLLNLRIDSDRQRQTEVEIQSLKTEVRQIQHQLPEPVQKPISDRIFLPSEEQLPGVPPEGRQSHDHGVNDDAFKKDRMELMEINDLQQNLTASQPNADYWWLRENHFQENHGTSGPEADSPARKKKTTSVQSTPCPATVTPILRELPSWNLSPVTSRVAASRTSSARYRVQAMLDKSLSRHIGNTSPSPFRDACTSGDAQFKKSLAGLKDSLEKTHLV